MQYLSSFSVHMRYALEMSKTAIPSSSSSALLLFGTSLLTISRHRAEKFMCQRHVLGLRLEFLAKQPTSDVWSTWVDRRRRVLWESVHATSNLQPQAVHLNTSVSSFPPALCESTLVRRQWRALPDL